MNPNPTIFCCEFFHHVIFGREREREREWWGDCVFSGNFWNKNMNIYTVGLFFFVHTTYITKYLLVYQHVMQQYVIVEMLAVSVVPC